MLWKSTLKTVRQTSVFVFLDLLPRMRHSLGLYEVRLLCKVFPPHIWQNDLCFSTPFRVEKPLQGLKVLSYGIWGALLCQRIWQIWGEMTIIPQDSFPPLHALKIFYHIVREKDKEQKRFKTMHLWQQSGNHNMRLSLNQLSILRTFHPLFSSIVTLPLA